MTLSTINYEVMVDWDGTDWAGVPDFSEDIDDISADVAYIDWSRGKDDEEGNAPASTLQVQMRYGLHSKYSLYNAASPLYGKIRPWLIIRVRAIHTATAHPVFFGFISSIKVNPHPSKQEVIFYVTDGIDLLARQLITQDYESKSKMSDGEAVESVLNVAGWSANRRDIDITGGADLLNYPDSYVY